MKYLIAAAFAALMLAACGGDDDAGRDRDNESQLPSCADIVGQPAEQLADGCMDVDADVIEAGGSQECVDGRTLYQAGDGLFGHSGEKVRQGAEDEVGRVVQVCVFGRSDPPTG